ERILNLNGPHQGAGSMDIPAGAEAAEMRFALKEEIENFAAKVVDLVTPKNTRGWKTRTEALWKDVQERGLKARTDATKKLYMSKFRKALRDTLREVEPNDKRRMRVEAGLMEIVRIDKEILTKLQEDYQSRVKVGNADLTVVPRWEWIVRMAREMTTSADMELRAIGLMMVTGRRFREILQTADFTAWVEKTRAGEIRHRWLLGFKGQLKTKGGVQTMYGKRFPIPVLAPANEVLTAFEGLRASPEGQGWLDAPERQLATTDNPRFNRSLQSSAIARYWPAKTPLRLKELRALYAEIAYVNFVPRTTRAPYYARVLGHGEEDLTTSLSYMKYMLNKEALAQGREEMNRLTMLRDRQREDAVAASGRKRDGDGASDEDRVSSDLVDIEKE
ncbi:MAG: protelomerase family protein, partial [Pseudomonadota bacterium]